MIGWSKEQYEAKQAKRAKERYECGKKPWWWLRQTDPVARFTAYLAVFTLALVFVSVFQWSEIHSGSADTKALAEAAKAQATAADSQVTLLKDQLEAFKKQARASVASASISASALSASTRPWIKIDAIDFHRGGIGIFDEQIIASPDVIIQNTGASPADNVTVIIEADYDFMRFASEYVDKQGCHTKFAPYTYQVGRPTTIIFPKQQINVQKALGLKRSDIKASAFIIRASVCVYYRFAGDNSLHMTSKLFTVSKRLTPGCRPCNNGFDIRAKGYAGKEIDVTADERGEFAN